MTEYGVPRNKYIVMVKYFLVGRNQGIVDRGGDFLLRDRFLEWFFRLIVKRHFPDCLFQLIRVAG